MSFEIAAALLSNHGEGLGDLHTVLQRNEFPSLVARNGTSTNATVNLFIDGFSQEQKYGASIISACGDATVYAIQCTSAPSYIGTATCGRNAPILTVTENADVYLVSYSTATRTLGYDVSATAIETCNLKGTTQAACTATIGGTAAGTTTTSTATTTYTGAALHRYTVEITAGAEKTASPAGTCIPKNAAPSLNTKSVALFGLLSTIGVIGFLGL
ncbi:hypothetical protein GQ53DRAFT_745883 [Thozetella sp. PMI_491]|nr:hypothetical protein GQ53DRAFT_745883 [Thozetella sp. PMI_491]